MTGAIHSLPGVVMRAERGFVDPEIVEKLEDLLAQAKVGGIKGFAFSVVSVDGMVRAHWVGSAVNSNEMHGAIALLSAWYADARVKDIDDGA